ncbi:MAG: OmpA family protein, partial [Bacteroidales bacterium]|nr:OmpA family protein [Bacteroidales bacterium]
VRGSATYNQELSEKRAQSVVEFLTLKGIDASRLNATGWGAQRLLVQNAVTEEEHQLNRRTTFNILNIEEISSRFVVKTFEPIEFPENIRAELNVNNTTNEQATTEITPESINNEINSFFEGESDKSIEDILNMINELFE